MKRIKKLKKYGLSLSKEIKRFDFAELDKVKVHLDDISSYTVGLVDEIGDTFSSGDKFDYAKFTKGSRRFFSRLETYINH